MQLSTPRGPRWVVSGTLDGAPALVDGLFWASHVDLGAAVGGMDAAIVDVAEFYPDSRALRSAVGTVWHPPPAAGPHYPGGLAVGWYCAIVSAPGAPLATRTAIE